MDNHPHRNADLRAEIKEFLSSRRARLTPDQVGVTVYGGIRRVPGLRREEVAMLAGVSTDYYVRLEKGNVTGISEDVLSAVAGALRLDEAERQHLFNLARAAGPARRRAARVPRRRADGLRPSLQWMLDVVTGGPAVIGNARLDIVAANPLGRAFYAPVLATTTETEPPNFARFCFLDVAAHDFYPDWEGAANVTVAQLRMAAGADPLDRELTKLVGELSMRSEDFRSRWASHDVRLHHTGTKQFNHPVVGLVEVAFHNIALPADPGLNMLVYAAAPGSASEDSLRVLSSWAAPQEGPAAPAADRGVGKDADQV